MSNAHLSQTISQLAAQQQVAYASPTPHAPSYQKNVQHWTGTSTPQPVKQSSSKSTRSSRLSKNPSSYSTPHAQRQETAPYYQQPAAQPHPYVPVIQNPPRPPLPPSRQALETSYPSRLRTGATLLVQPILANLPVVAGPSVTTAVLSARTSSRRGGAVNYVDPGSGDDMPDAGAIDSDDSDFIASGGTRTAVRQTGRGGRNPTNGVTAFNANATGAAAGKAELDQSYLGLVPPARFIKVQAARPSLHEYPSEDELTRHATLPSALIPIRVEFETETLRVRDCFVWNLHETLIKPESFARTFCGDLDIPLSPWMDTIANQIRAQIEEHEGVASMDLGNGQEGLAPAPLHVEPNMAQDLEEIEKPTDVEEVPECRVVVSIDVQIATHHLLDHIEWDLLSSLTPEDFARQLCAELGLGGEAVSLISHAIHEELIKHKKDAIEWGVIGGDREPTRSLFPADTSGGGGVGISAVKDKTGLGLGWGRTPKDGRGPKRLRSIWRDWAEAEEFRTKFEVLTAEEVERREIEKERASRRLRRETSKFQGTRSRRR